MVMTAPVTGIGAVIIAIWQDAHLSLLLLISVPVLTLIVELILWCSLPLFGRIQGFIDQGERHPARAPSARSCAAITNAAASAWRTTI